MLILPHFWNCSVDRQINDEVFYIENLNIEICSTSFCLDSQMQISVDNFLHVWKENSVYPELCWCAKDRDVLKRKSW